jgi:hypothetical protein
LLDNEWRLLVDRGDEVHLHGNQDKGDNHQDFVIHPRGEHDPALQVFLPRIIISD